MSEGKERPRLARVRVGGFVLSYFPSAPSLSHTPSARRWRRLSTAAAVAPPAPAAGGEGEAA